MRSPKPTLPATSRCGKRACSWNISPIPRRCGGVAARSRPSRTTRPRSSRCRPAIARRRVDLPEPLGPSRATVSPSPTSRTTPSSAATPSKLDREIVRPQAHSGLRAPAGAASDERRSRREHRQHDGERRGRALVLRARPAEEAEDRDRQRRPVRLSDEDRRAELAERDREREPGGGAERAARERQVDLAADPCRRGAEQRRRLAQLRAESSGWPAPRSGRRTARRRAPARRARATATRAARAAARRRRSRSRSRASRRSRRAAAGRARRASPLGAARARAASSPPSPSASAVAIVAKASELATASHGVTRRTLRLPPERAVVVEAEPVRRRERAAHERDDGQSEQNARRSEDRQRPPRAPARAGGAAFATRSPDGSDRPAAPQAVP